MNRIERQSEIREYVAAKYSRKENDTAGKINPSQYLIDYIPGLKLSASDNGKILSYGVDPRLDSKNNKVMIKTDITFADIMINYLKYHELNKSMMFTCGVDGQYYKSYGFLEFGLVPVFLAPLGVLEIPMEVMREMYVNELRNRGAKIFILKPYNFFTGRVVTNNPTAMTDLWITRKDLNEKLGYKYLNDFHEEMWDIYESKLTELFHINAGSEGKSEVRGDYITDEADSLIAEPNALTAEPNDLTTEVKNTEKVNNSLDSSEFDNIIEGASLL